MTQPIKQFVDLATICWRQSRIVKLLDKSNSDIQRLEREVDRFGRVLRSCDIEINDYEGRKNNNLNIETASIELDSTIKDEIIFETITPEIKYKGEIQKKSRVVVHKPIKGNATDINSPPIAVNKWEPDSFDAGAEKEKSENPYISIPDKLHEGKNSSRKNLVAFVWLTIISCAVILVAILSFTDLVSDIQMINGEMNNIIEEKNTIIDEQRDRIFELEEAKKRLEQAVSQANDADENDQENVENEDAVMLIRYTVQAGDTLYSICESNNLDYNEYAQLIKSINGITDPNKIYVGQALFLPMPIGKK